MNKNNTASRFNSERNRDRLADLQDAVEECEACQDPDDHGYCPEHGPQDDHWMAS